MSISFITDLITRIKVKIGIGFPTQELKGIERLIQEGNLEEALTQVKIIEEKDGLDKKLRLRCQILKCNILIQKQNYEKGLELAEQVMKESTELKLPLIKIDAIICQANALLGLGKFDDCLNVIEDSENQLKSIERNKRIDLAEKQAALFEVKGKVQRRKGDFKGALDLLHHSLSTREELKNLYEKAGLLNTIGIIHASKGEFDLALEHLQQSLVTYEDLGITQPTIKLFNNIGLIYSYKGELDKSVDYYQKSLDLSEKFGNKQNAAALSLNIGQTYLHKGELDLALDYTQRSLVMHEELDSKNEIAMCLNNMGNIFESKGELVQALEAYTRSLKLFEEIGKIQDTRYDTAVSFNNIGNVYRTRGDSDKAISYYKQSLDLFEEIGTNLEASTALLNLIYMAVHWEGTEDAQPYLQKLQEINDKEENKTINQIYRLSRAIILRTSDRVIKQAEAQQLFQEIAEEEIIQHDNTVQAMLNLCEILLQELRTSGNEEVLYEIKEMLQKLQTIAENQNSFSVLVDTYLLKSKMALLELDLDSARQLLDDAQQIAEEKGLQKLAMMISGEYDMLMDQLGKWTDLIDQNVPMIEKLELTELEGMVTRIIRKKAETPKFVEEEPALLLILSESGSVRFSKQFVSEEILNDRIIGDLLTAINSFIQETFSATGSIERVKHKEHTLLMKPIESLLCCYMFKGQSYSALQKLDKFIEKVKDSRSLWRLMTSPKKPEKQSPAEKEMEKITEDIFLSPHTAVILQDQS
ncbi:MAG: tetratricopeptide repeat protein [Promethearchaeota archaeon]